MAKNWEQVMALRNRKQVPVCELCHKSVIHAGKYVGDYLTSKAPKLLFDNRTLHLESFVKKLPDKQHHAKTLQQKGWYVDNRHRKKLKKYNKFKYDRKIK